jgi:hypothetical protein
MAAVSDKHVESFQKQFANPEEEVWKMGTDILLVAA